MTFPYPTVSSWFEDNEDFEENLRMEVEDQSYAEWEAEHAEDLAEAAYTEWAHMREEDGMPFTREDYDAHIDALIAASEPD